MAHVPPCTPAVIAAEPGQIIRDDAAPGIPLIDSISLRVNPDRAVIVPRMKWTRSSASEVLA
jgi:hypothetical protein